MACGRRLGDAVCDECETWPSGRFKDQIDAAAGVFNKLAASSSYNLDYKQWAY